MRIVVRAIFFGASFRNGFGAFHHELSAEFAEVSGGLGFDDMFTVRVIRAAVKESEAAAAFGHFSVGAFSAFNARVLFGFFRRIGFDEFAFRIIAARDELAETAVAFHELISAFRAIFIEHLRTFQFASIQHSRSVAFGEFCAAQKAPVLAEFDDHIASADRAAHFFGRIADVRYLFYFLL